MHECMYCDQSFSWLQDLVMHLAYAHPTEMGICIARAAGHTVRCWCDDGRGWHPMRYHTIGDEAMSPFARHLARHGGAAAHFLQTRLGVEYTKGDNDD